MSEQPEVHRVEWVIPRNVWIILITWGVAVLVLAGLFYGRIELNQRANDKRDADLRRDLCAVMTGIAVGPTPPPGPDGDRARDLIPKMNRLRETSCG